MKPFKGSSNKLVATRFPGQVDVEPPFEWHTNVEILIETEAALYPSCHAPFALFRVTTNKLEMVLTLD